MHLPTFAIIMEPMALRIAKNCNEAPVHNNASGSVNCAKYAKLTSAILGNLR